MVRRHERLHHLNVLVWLDAAGKFISNLPLIANDGTLAESFQTERGLVAVQNTPSASIRMARRYRLRRLSTSKQISMTFCFQGT
jgi:hypothetical protein